ncbi:pyridoxal phosphate-dependent transferase [Crassisporium funariophilum]|nr:pyridoxal phosphate-dependent transferase [Crassisporium funariophilum]
MSLFPSPDLAKAIPPNTPHSVVHSLPEWKDNVEFAKSNQALFDSLETTYPRFVLHPFVKQFIAPLFTSSSLKLNKKVLSASNAEDGTCCLLFPSRKTADECLSFARRQFPHSSSRFSLRRVTEALNPPLPYEIFAIFFPVDHMESVMKFWTFAGGGVSTRLAEQCLLHNSGVLQPELHIGIPTQADHLFSEYYRKNAPLSSVANAKDAIRMRFSGIMVDGGNIRGVPGVSVDDIYLYPTGMSAVWYSHQLLAGTIGLRNGFETLKTAHVNILYVDSYKLLGLASPGYHFFTNDTIDGLERLLEEGTPERPAILGLFTDFPGNPHLRSADLPRLRALADSYNIPLIIDETVGFHLNVQLLPYADVIVSSLTKVFSGLANVLGGALMLNPTSRFYAEFKAHMVATYEDTYFGNDALVMEANSRGIEKRVSAINHNAEALADMLYLQSSVAGAKDPVIQEVFYPKYQSRENYDRCLNVAAAGAGIVDIGYSCLLSVSFTSLGAAQVFYSALRCYKGPTLGTVFTIATPFTAIAFPPEKMEWVKEHNLEEALVRFSVGVEDTEKLLSTVSEAVKAAKQWAKSLQTK